MVTRLPFGTWPSPLTSHGAAALRVSRSGVDSDGHHLYWLESRPDEGGRTALVRAVRGTAPEEVSPPASDLRSAVYEYGGGAFCVLPGPSGSPRVAAVDRTSQRILLCDPATRRSVHLTPPPPEGERWCHGDLHATADGRWVLAVRERRAGGSPERSLVACDVELPGRADVLVSTLGFLGAPRACPGSERLAFVRWHHPQLRWESSVLQVADVRLGGDGSVLSGERTVAGGDGVSVGQPLWRGAGALAFTSDAEGWWQPWEWSVEGGRRRLCAQEADFQVPDWTLGQAGMALLADDRIACRWHGDGRDLLGVLDPATGRLEALAQPCVTVAALCAHGDGVAWLGRTAVAGTAVWWVDLAASGGAVTAGGAGAAAGAVTAGGAGAAAAAGAVTAGVSGAVRWCPEEAPALDPGDVSRGRPFSFTGPSGRVVHGLHYPPRLQGVEGPDGERPPLLVVCHGGPTGAAEAGFDVVVQYFTTRGFAVAAVDYGGSSGYGRAYRDVLRGQWGVVDVDDCVDAADELVRRGEVDGSRLAIRGTSAGGFTALNAMARSDRFAAATAWYGVTDLLALAATTHDFEAHYHDWLVGELPACEEVYRRRSPRFRVDDMTGAVLLLQGLEDPVVPPAQAEAMAAALRRRGLRCEHRTFAGESHGFRRADTVAASLAAEHEFYLEVLAPPPPSAGMLAAR